MTLEATGIGSCVSTVVSDAMILTITPAPSADLTGVSSPGSVCSDAISYTVAGASASNGTIQWATSGDGAFVDPSALNPVYNLGPGDQVATDFTLTMNVLGNGSCPNTSDAITINVQPAPTSDAGSDAEICEGDTYRYRVRRQPITVH